MSITIRYNPDSKKKQYHPCSLPYINNYPLKTKISCDDCGQWWKLKWSDGVGPLPGIKYWKRMHKRDRYPRGSVER